MLHSQQIEELMCLVASLDRTNLTRQFLSFRGRFPVDFTPEFLQTLSVDRLRHIFVALCLQNRAMPNVGEIPAMTAAVA